jgi:hypothetical protein
LKEELSKKPYAGLSIVYMIDIFDQLTENDITDYWDKCCEVESIYKAELCLLSKSNLSRFSRFILEYGIKRKDDALKRAAWRFIDRLKELPEYEAIIEEGSEEAI